MSHYYRNTELIHTMGQDFAYSNASRYFKNVDKLLAYINNHSELGVNIFYSTPKNYIQSINKQKTNYPIKSDDFFPYADTSNSYWTGYFASRVALKGIVKAAGRFLQSVRTLFALIQINENSMLRSEMNSHIFELEQAMGILQHHDAVAGTSTQYVANDYMRIITSAIEKVHKVYIFYIEDY